MIDLYRVQVPFEEGAAWVVSVDGLIALKRLRGSPLDLLDIEALRAPGDEGQVAPGEKRDA
jgi:hypothetical protein